MPSLSNPNSPPSISGSSIPSAVTAPRSDDDASQVWQKDQRQIDMEKKWVIIDDLMGGTSQMRYVAQRWLPKEEKESTTTYQNRLKRTFLYEGLADTLEKHAARPFSVPVSTKGSLPTKLQPITSDVDRTGRSLHELSEEMFRDLEKYGITHLLIDTPAIEGPLSVADEERRKIRPYFVHVAAKRFIGGRQRVTAEGEVVWSQVRFAEFHEEPAGRYGTNIVQYIRVISEAQVNQSGELESGTWELWKQNDDDNTGQAFTRKKSGSHAFSGPGVPFVTIQLNKTDDGGAYPPMQKLAEMNVLHWQSSSDHRNILKFARIGILFGKGFSREQVEKGIVVSPTQAYLTANENADLKYVEYDPSIIEAGEKDLQALEARMEVLGLQPLLERAKDVTATAAGQDEAKGMTILQMWLTRLEKGLNRAFQVAAKWYEDRDNSVKLPDDFGVEIYKDFFVSGDPNENEFLLNAAMLGKLDTETFLYEIQRRGVIAPHHDLNEISKKGAEEAESRAETEMQRSIKRGEVEARQKQMLARSGKGQQKQSDPEE